MALKFTSMFYNNSGLPNSHATNGENLQNYMKEKKLINKHMSLVIQTGESILSISQRGGFFAPNTHMHSNYNLLDPMIALPSTSPSNYQLPILIPLLSIQNVNTSGRYYRTSNHKQPLMTLSQHLRYS